MNDNIKYFEKPLECADAPGMGCLKTSRMPESPLFWERRPKATYATLSRNREKATRLALQLQFSFEMGFARVGLMSPAPGRPCEDVGVRDAPLS